MILGIIIAVAVLIADQLSKFWILNDVLDGYSLVEVSSFFNIVYAWNTGVSFSMFSASGATGTVILSLVAGAIVVALLWWLYKEKIRTIQVGLGMIIGGALGNIVDRVRLGAVFDFLDFHFAGHHWPAFNLADSFICIGAVIIILQSLFTQNSKNGKEQNK